MMVKRKRTEKYWIEDQMFTRTIIEDIPEPAKPAAPAPKKVDDDTKVIPKPKKKPATVKKATKKKAPASYFTKSELKDNQKNDLKRMCKSRKLSVVGTKQELMDRLMEYQGKKNER